MIDKFKNFLDAGFFINLPHRVDKCERIKSHLNHLGLNDFINRFDGVYPKDLGFFPKNDNKYEILEYSIAAANAHKNIIKHAKEKNLKNVLVLEDDTLFIDNGVNNLYNALEQIQSIKDWEVLYIGGDSNDSKFEYVGKNLVKVKNISCCHAYIINNNFYDTVLNTEPITHYDTFLNGYARQKYLVYPLSIVQEHLNKTDIGETNITFGRSYWEKTYTNK